MFNLSSTCVGCDYACEELSQRDGSLSVSGSTIPDQSPLDSAAGNKLEELARVLRTEFDVGAGFIAVQIFKILFYHAGNYITSGNLSRC